MKNSFTKIKNDMKIFFFLFEKFEKVKNWNLVGHGTHDTRDSEIKNFEKSQKIYGTEGGRCRSKKGGRREGEERGGNKEVFF